MANKFLDLNGFKYFISKIIGKTSIAGIGDGTCTGAVRILNDNLTPVVYQELQEKTFTTAEWTQGTGGSTWTCPEDGLYYVSCYFMGHDSNLTMYKHQLVLNHGTNMEIKDTISEYGTASDPGWTGTMPDRLLSAIVPINKGDVVSVNVHTPEAGKQVNTRMWIVRLRKGYNDVIWNKF